MSLSFRVARQDDYDLLVELRKECGWGLAKLESGWTDPDRIFCVLSVNEEDVGMACWCLEYPDGMASKKDRIVHLASLFIRRKHQGAGLGGQAMALLERVAVNNYNAEWITLDTAAYHVTHDGIYCNEDASRPNRVIAWYRARGYEEFKTPKPLFAHPTRANPDHLLTAAFLRKPASLVKPA